MPTTEFWVIVVCMTCVIALVVLFIPDSFIIRQDVYEKMEILYKLCIFVVLLLFIVAVLYISWLRPPEIILGI